MSRGRQLSRGLRSIFSKDQVLDRVESFECIFQIIDVRLREFSVAVRLLVQIDKVYRPGDVDAWSQCYLLETGGRRGMIPIVPMIGGPLSRWRGMLRVLHSKHHLFQAPISECRASKFF